MKKIKLLLLLSAIIFAGCSTSNDVTILPRSSWEANSPRPFKAQVPVRITIHHEGTKFTADQNAAEHIKNVQVWGMGPDRNWVDIPYHFLIGPNGDIYEGRNVFTTGETNTEYDPQGHLLISCLGNFEVQEMGEKQLNALIDLVAYCCDKYDISPDSIASHKDYSKITDCPGKNLYKYIQNGYIKNEVKKRLQ